MTDMVEHVSRNLDRWVDELRALCRIPTVAGRDPMDRAAAAVAERLEAAGAKTEIIPTAGCPVVLGELGEGPKTLMFYNHYDVQPPEPLDEWDSHPYAAEVRDGRIIARGVSDNKGPLMSRIQAVELLQSLGMPQTRLLFVVEGEEEIGSPSLEPFVHEQFARLRADGCVWEAGDVNEQGRLGLYLGGKGICYLDLEVTADRPDLHSGQAAAVVNPLWRLVWALSTIKDPDDRILVRGFFDSVRELTGIERELATSVATEIGLPAQQLLVTDPAEIAHRLMFSPTATICGIDGGYQGPGSKTVLPRTAKAKLDFRLVPDQDPDEIERLVREHLAARGFGDVRVTPQGHLSPARTDPTAPIVEVARSAARAVYGIEPAVFPSMPGSGPLSLFIGDLGIPTVSLGVGYHGSLAHAPNENVRIEDYRRGILMAAEVIRRFSSSE